MLSKNDMDILNKMVGHGGYITKEILHLYRNDITINRCYRILVKLEGMKYIRRREYFQSSREPMVYQVTRKACALFHRPDAYMRKVHEPYAVRRYLMRSHFLFLLEGQGVPVTLYTSDERASYLLSLGYREYHLPKKINKEEESIQMEEYLLQQLCDAEHLCFLYVDNLRYKPMGQLKLLWKRYEKIARVKLYRLKFIIVVENEWRKRQFEQVKMDCDWELKVVSIERNYQAQMVN